VLEVKDIHTYYGDSYSLQGVSLRVEPGQVVAVLGRNGVGKTTLAHSINGFVPPRRGSIRFHGTEIQDLPVHRIARMGIGLVPQGRRMFPSLTVLETLRMAEGLAHKTRHGGSRIWSIERLFEAFPRLRERSANRSQSLSGGEQQMLAMGRALAINSGLLLLDEPTEGLAPLLVAELDRILRDLIETGVSMLLIEQNVTFALRLADVVCIMSKGRIVHTGSPDALRHNDEVMTKYLGV
jgi:branched-chain amino acid transport system ATP-binding protein